MKQKVLETVALAFKLVDDLLLGGGAADDSDGRDAQVVRSCKLEEKLRVVRKETRKSIVKELDQVQQEAERTCDDALKNL